MIYASDEGLEILSHCKKVVADGTFYSSPSFANEYYKQTFIIQGWYQGHMIPCVYVFMITWSR